MAVQVTLDFTDAQWVMVLEHYRNSIGDAPITTTEEFKSALMTEVERAIRKQVDRKSREQNKDVFNV